MIEWIFFAGGIIIFYWIGLITGYYLALKDSHDLGWIKDGKK